MMDVKRFDWDKYVRSASYYAVLDGTDYSHKIPTMFSPDKKQIYLQSDDIAYDVEDIEMLKLKLSALLERLKKEARSVDWSYEKLYLLQVDYLTIFTILADRSALPDDHNSPEENLRIAMEEFKNQMRKTPAQLPLPLQ